MGVADYEFEPYNAPWLGEPVATDPPWLCSMNWRAHALMLYRFNSFLQRREGERIYARWLKEHGKTDPRVSPPQHEPRDSLCPCWRCVEQAASDERDIYATFYKDQD